MYTCMQACMFLCMYLCMYSLYEGGCVYRVTNKRKHKTKQTHETNRRTQTQETNHSQPSARSRRAAAEKVSKGRQSPKDENSPKRGGLQRAWKRLRGQARTSKDTQVQKHRKQEHRHHKHTNLLFILVNDEKSFRWGSLNGEPSLKRT